MTATPARIMPHTTRADSLVLAAVPTAVHWATLFTHHTLTAWQLDPAVVTTAEYVTGELAAHAVETTGIVDGQPFYRPVYDNLACIRIWLNLAEGRLFVRVWDRDPTPPIVDAANRPVDPHLRNVVDAAVRAGYVQLPSGGKILWAETSNQLFR